MIRLQLQSGKTVLLREENIAVYTCNGILPSTFFISQNTYLKTLTCDRNMIIFEVYYCCLTGKVLLFNAAIFLHSFTCLPLPVISFSLFVFVEAQVQ